MRKIFIIGGTTFDHIVRLSHFPQPIPQTIHTAPFHEGTGSTGSGKALNLTRLGVPNTLYSVLGDDIYGRHIINDLKTNGVEFIYDTDPAGTERHVNIMDEKGGRISMFITQSSEKIDHTIQAVKEAIATSDVIVLNIIAYCRHLIPLLQNINKPIWTDLHDYDGSNTYHNDFISAAQYIHLSSDNLPDYRKVMHRFIQEGKELVICTHGKEGATLLTKEGTWIEQAALVSYPLTDSNGAGDAFHAGFLAGWIKESNLSTCMQMGAVCAAWCVGSKQLFSPQLTPALLAAEVQRHFK
jgi:acarbose 7IV-phosphotransferase